MPWKCDQTNDDVMYINTIMVLKLLQIINTQYNVFALV